jgi:hypothetical protein
LVACRLGELVEIDSTPLDVLVLLEEGVPGRVELTGMVDLATRSIPAAVLRPTTKSVDAALLLAHTATPEPMRPGWTEVPLRAAASLDHADQQRFYAEAARRLHLPHYQPSGWDPLARWLDRDAARQLREEHGWARLK